MLLACERLSQIGVGYCLLDCCLLLLLLLSSRANFGGCW